MLLKMRMVIGFIWASIKQHISTQTLMRSPEPNLITDNTLSVLDFANVSDNQLITFYTQALGLIRSNLDHKGNAIEVCSGPGLFSSYLSKYIQIDNVTGIDLSEPMLKVARRHNKDGVSFKKGDMTKLYDIADKSTDLICNLNALHHVENISDLEKAYFEMDRVCRDDGMVFALDLIRPKNIDVLEKILKATNPDVLRKNQQGMAEDYYYSLHAGFTPEEHMSCLPKNSERRWFLIRPLFFPVFQVFIGLPKHKIKISRDKALSKKEIKEIVPKSLLLDNAIIDIACRLNSVKVLEIRENQISKQKMKELYIA